jgi:hypothetical protein
MKKAVLFTAFNRLEYLKETLDSWSKVDDKIDYDFHFYVEPSDVVKDIVDSIIFFRDNTGVRAFININKNVLGTGGNTWKGFDDLFIEYEFVILAEDDVIVSKDILRYFNAAERMYRDDKEIAIISANTKWDTYAPADVIREQGFNGLVWGTWSRYWSEYFKDNWDKDYSSDPIHNGWDWHLNLRLLPSNGLKNINPLASRSNHIGINGMHCDESMFNQTKSSSFKEDHNWLWLEEVNL